MKSLYSTTIAFVAFFILIPVVHAAPSFPSWSEKLGPNKRFTVLTQFNSEAVLDNETGLVWEQSIETTRVFKWNEAQNHCNQVRKGNRLGWRLPTIQELATLVDPATVELLPPSNPFSNVQGNVYWSATSDANNNLAAWSVDFSNIAGIVVNGLGKANQINAWCVRGGQGVDPQ